MSSLPAARCLKGRTSLLDESKPFARDAAEAGIWNYGRRIHSQFTREAGNRRILLHQQRGYLFVYDFPVVGFVRVVAEQCLDVFGQPAKVGIIGVRDVHDVLIGNRDIQSVGFTLVIDLEVFDQEGKLLAQRAACRCCCAVA